MSKWISVNDKRKPKVTEGELVSETVLLYVPDFRIHEDTGVHMGNWLSGSKVFRPEGSYGFEDRVTHWMPLPSPPKENNEPSM